MGALAEREVIQARILASPGNRRTKLQTEPLDTFRAYMATYAYEQAFCHASEQLVHNLERHWNARERSTPGA